VFEMIAMRTPPTGLSVLIVVLVAACSKRASPKTETCDPTTAATWATPDDRPKARGPSPGCGKPLPRGRVLRPTLMVDGRPRTYTAVTAWALATGEMAPLVFVFHGSGGSGEGVRRFGFEGAVAGKAMVVYPQGLPIEAMAAERAGT
jgi:hypothetical protein